MTLVKALDSVKSPPLLLFRINFFFKSQAFRRSVFREQVLENNVSILFHPELDVRRYCWLVLNLCIQSQTCTAPHTKAMSIYACRLKPNRAGRWIEI